MRIKNAGVVTMVVSDPLEVERLIWDLRGGGAGREGAFLIAEESTISDRASVRGGVSLGHPQAMTRLQ